MLKCGDAFLMAQPRVSVEHLWIVATEPLPNTDQVIIVNVTKARDHSDKTVILRPGDHPFVKTTSVIYFHGSLVTDLKQVEKGFAARICSPHRPCSPQLIRRIQQGLLESGFTPNGIKEFYRRTITMPA
jgi:hypothetical protein